MIYTNHTSRACLRRRPSPTVGKRATGFFRCWAPLFSASIASHLSFKYINLSCQHQLLPCNIHIKPKRKVHTSHIRMDCKWKHFDVHKPFYVHDSSWSSFMLSNIILYKQLTLAPMQTIALQGQCRVGASSYLVNS